MVVDYISALGSMEFILLIHMAANIAAIYTVTGWMAGYVSGRNRYWSAIHPFLFAAIFVGCPVALACSIAAPIENHSVTELIANVVVLELMIFVVFTAPSENRTSLKQMKEKLDSFPGWRYWFDGDQQSQLVNALRVAMTRDKARNVPAMSAAQTMLMAVLGNPGIFVHFQEIPKDTPEGSHLASRIFLWAASIMLLARITRIFGERIMPGVGLIHHGLAHITRSGVNDQQPTLHVRIARWRNPEHQRLFQLADALEKCIYPVRRRVSQVDFDTVSTAFSALALAVRREATRFTSDGKLRPEVLSWMCITLATNTNLVQSAERVAALVPNEASMVQPLPKSRVSDTLGRVNDVLAQNTRAFILLAVVFVITYCLATGDVAKLFEFLKSAVS